MIPEERIQKITALLRERKTVSIGDIMQHVYASISTVRRDLIELEQQGVLRRIKGGATLVASTTSEFSGLVRSSEHTAEKQTIAQLASRFLHDDMALFMDSSTTVYNLAPYLRRFRHVVVITNSVMVPMTFVNDEEITVFCSGGRLKNHSHSLIGTTGNHFLSEFHPELCFFSVKGVDHGGCNDVDAEQVVAKQIMIRNAQKAILLADESKFSTEAYIRVAPFEDLAAIVTNRRPNYYDELEEAAQKKIIWE